MTQGNKRKIVFNISSDYKALKILGEGAYGVVCMAVHLPTGRKVAIKKIIPFSHKLLCIRTLREINLLKKFRLHGNIVRLIDVQVPKSYNEFTEVYLIQEFMPADLCQVIEKFKLNDDHVKYFMYQIFRGLKFMHSAGVIHRDLKPSNILVNDNCDLKICDLGLSRPCDNLEEGILSGLTEYVATRWYRAPEIMLTTSKYSTLVDLWSAGCILGELFAASPLFPGKDYRHQIMLILHLLGTPTEEDISYLKNEKAKRYLDSLPACPKLDLLTTLQQHPKRLRKYGNEAINPLAIDLATKLLCFNPWHRLNATQSLSHPYLEMYHQIEDEPIAVPLDPSEYSFDKPRDQLTLQHLKDELYSTIINFRI